MCINLEKLPFYKAIHLFEKGDYKTAFELFLNSAKNGNMHAVFYLDYILKNKNECVPFPVPDEHSEFLKTIDEHIEQVPDKALVKAPFQASLFIISFNKETIPKKRNKIIKQLESFKDSAPNAAIFIAEFYKQNNDKKKFQEQLKLLADFADISTLEYLSKQSDEDQKSYTKTTVSEIQELKKISVLAYRTKEGTTEQIFSKYYNGPQEGPEPKPSPFQRNGSRKLQWRKTAAYMGNADLQFLFSIPHPVFNKKTEQEYAQWKFMAAFSGEFQALIQMATHYYNEDLRFFKKDYYKVGLCLLRAIKDQNRLQKNQDYALSAYIILGSFHDKGLGNLMQDDVKAKDYYLKALELMSQGIVSASNSNSMAYYNMAVFYESGRGGLNPDCKKAIEYFQLALQVATTDSERVSAHRALGDILFNENFSMDLFEGALTHYQKALELEQHPSNIAKIHLSMAQLYATKDLDLYIEEYQKHLKLAYLANPQSLDDSRLFLLAQFVSHQIKKMNEENPVTKILKGDAFKKEEPLLIKILMEAASKKDEESIINLTLHGIEQKLYSQNNYGLTLTRLIELLSTIADSSPRATFLLGILYRYHHKPALHQKAIECFQKGMASNQGVSFFEMGTYYEQGCPEIDLAPDYKKAFECYSAAANLEIHTALVNKGQFLLWGRVIPQDIKLGVECLENALKQDQYLAAYNLGEFYRSTDSADPKKIAEYFKIGAKSQDPDALTTLGYCYSIGFGLEQDHKMAMELYHKALQVDHQHTRAAANYTFEKLFEIIDTGEIDETILKDLQHILKPSMEKGYARSIFAHAMISLLLDTNAVKTVIESLTTLLKHKPHKISQLAVQYLEKYPKISILDVFILLRSSDPEKTKLEMEALLHANGLVNAGTASASPAPGAAANNGIHASNDAAANNRRDNPAAKKLITDIQWFTDPRNVRRLKFSDFNHIVAELLKSTQMDGFIKSSKKGTSYKVKSHPSDKSLHWAFNYHQNHGSAHSSDKVSDLNRAKSLQKSVRQLQKLSAAS